MAAADTVPLISVEGLVKTYGDKVAVDGVDLSVHGGEVFGLLGPNGAGKTTTILMLLGLTEPTEGTVRICGLDPAHDAVAVKRRVGYLPDAVGFYSNLTARQNLRYTARLNEIDPDHAEDRIEHLLEEVGLERVGDQRVGTFSRGMKQRLGIADVLLKDPEVVILDEPTAAIDPAGVVEILALINKLAHQDGRAVLLSSHLLNQVQEVCDRVGIFVAGRMIAEGTPDSLARDLAEQGTVYELWVDVSGDELEQALREGGQAATITPAGVGRFRVVSDDRDISGMVRTLVGAGIDLRQVRDLGSNLDRIYQTYFEREEQLRT